MSARYELDWHILTTEPYAGLIVSGLVMTFAVTLVSLAASFLLGLGVAFARTSNVRAVRLVATVYVEIVRNIPGLFWILFFYFVFPELLPRTWGSALHQMPSYTLIAGILGLTVDNSAYVSDIVRAGIRAVDPGQKDAAESCGLSPWQARYCIVWPQTLQMMLPPLTNRVIHNFKNSSLCMAISLPELTWATQQIESVTFHSIETTLFATVVYCAISLGLAYGMQALARPRKVATAEPAAWTQGVRQGVRA